MWADFYKITAHRFFCSINMKKSYIILIAIFIGAILCISNFSYAAKKKEPLRIKVTSEPSGAKVYMDGVLVCPSTPGVVSFPDKRLYFYTIEKNRVSDTSKPPFSKKFTFVKDGYESTTEVFEGGYYDVSQGYYMVKPTTYGVMAFLKKDKSVVEERENKMQSNVSNANDVETFLIRWFFEAAPENSRIYWRAISSNPTVKNTSELYLGTTPFDETRNLKIEGLNRGNAADVQIEIKVVNSGYKTSIKRFNALQVINQQEMSWFFELQQNAE